jgi:putative membrane protein
MKEPIARTIPTEQQRQDVTRQPRAFAPAHIEIIEAAELNPVNPPPDAVVPQKRMGFAGKLAWGAGSLLVSLGLGLMAERLIRDLFARYEWLGWVGIGALAVLVVAIVVLGWREIAALVRLRTLDGLRSKAVEVLVSNKPGDGRAILVELAALYHGRPDLARARKDLEANARDILDGAEFVRLSERMLMASLDARAKALTAASARRVALVTAVSPRALVDIAFVSYESIRLAGAIAGLYGARPGFFGFWRLAGAILGHLAITGGLVLTDGIVEQLVGQGLAAKLSARLGEGLVNGLMTVRVGIAAMRVIRPLPFDTQKQPLVKDFIPELANLARSGPKE